MLCVCVGDVVDVVFSVYIVRRGYDAAYKRWSCHSGLKLLCKLCRTSPPPAMRARFTEINSHTLHPGHTTVPGASKDCS